MRSQIYEPAISLGIHVQILAYTTLFFNCSTQSSNSLHSRAFPVYWGGSICDQEERSTLQNHEVHSLSKFFLRPEWSNSTIYGNSINHQDGLFLTSHFMLKKEISPSSPGQAVQAKQLSLNSFLERSFRLKDRLSSTTGTSSVSQTIEYTE